MDLEKAKAYAREKHKGQKRKQGTPYIEHPMGVMNLLIDKGIYDLEYLISALFHDILEDTDGSEEEILKYGNENILATVKLLTKEEDYDMEEYILNIGGNEMARVIKLADRAYNLKDAQNSEDEEFIESYIEETENYYTKLSQDTVFEKEIDFNLRLLTNHLAKIRRGG